MVMRLKIHMKLKHEQNTVHVLSQHLSTIFSMTLFESGSLRPPISAGAQAATWRFTR
jgi:hypothetical protein